MFPGRHRWWLQRFPPYFPRFSIFQFFWGSCWKLCKLPQCYLCTNGLHVICLSHANPRASKTTPVSRTTVTNLTTGRSLDRFRAFVRKQLTTEPKIRPSGWWLMPSMWCKRPKATSHSPSVLSQVQMISNDIEIYSHKTVPDCMRKRCITVSTWKKLELRKHTRENYFTSSYPHHDIYTFCYWQIFWHSIWHIFWHSIWHIFWHSIWHIFWHSTWHIFCNLFWHIF